MSHALAGRFFTTSATWARTYSGNRNLAIDTISSCYFESLGMVHIDAPEFIIRKVMLKILQARILEWVAMASSRGSSLPRVPTCISYVSCTGRQVLYH